MSARHFCKQGHLHASAAGAKTCEAAWRHTTRKRLGTAALERELRPVLASARARRRRRNPAGVRIVYNRVLGGWFIVRGPHQTPISGRFNSKAAAKAWLAAPPSARRNPRGSAAARGAAGARARRRARRLPGRGYLRLPRDPRARQLALLRRLQAIGAGGRQRNPLPDPVLGTVLTRDELERVQALLEDGFTVLLQPLADQVVIATVDLDKLTALVGDPRASLH